MQCLGLGCVGWGVPKLFWGKTKYPSQFKIVLGDRERMETLLNLLILGFLASKLEIILELP